MLGFTASSTVYDLTALANSFLGANCTGTPFPNGFGGLLTSSVTAVNDHWNDCGQMTDPCTGAIIGVGPTSTTNPLLFEEIKVYPNPASTLVNVDFTAQAASALTLRLVTLDGRLIEQLRTDIRPGENKLQLDVQTTPAGLYLLMLVGETGVATERLVIMRN